MPVRKEKRNGRWRFEKKVRLSDGSCQRISGTPNINTKQAAEAAERAEIDRVLRGRPSRKGQVPTLEEFSVEFMESYVAANNKPSERISKESLFRVHLLPAFGKRRLDAITTRDVEKFKAARIGVISAKRINNALTCLSKCLKEAEELEVIDSLPRIRFLKVCQPDFDFLDFSEWDRLRAACDGPESLAAILLGGDADLRHGEIRALQWMTWTWLQAS